MTVSKAVRKLRLQEWAKQIVECENSGLSVSEWCEKNEVGYKNYYYRKRRVREELLDAVEESDKASIAVIDDSPEVSPMPVFASVSGTARMSGNYASAVTVQIGTYIAEITNGADMETVEGVLRTLSRL